MSYAAPTYYHKSPFVDIIGQENGDKGLIHNTMTGKAYQVGSLIQTMLQYFYQPHTDTEFEEYFIEIGDKSKNVLSFFINNKLIIDKRGSKDLTQATIPANIRFFDYPQWDTHSTKSVFVGIPFGKGNGRSMGAANAPLQLREFNKKLGLNFMKGSMPNPNFLGAFFKDKSHKLYRNDCIADAGDLYISSNESMEFVYEKIFNIADFIFKTKANPLFIGGDHSISYPLIKAAAKHFHNLHIIHFDAHTDTYQSRYDSIEHSGKIHHHGNFMSKCLELDSVVQVYQFGIRGLTNAYVRESDKQKIIWADNTEAIELPADVPYYVTFDIDVFDPTILRGTATPVAGGFSLKQVGELLYQLLNNKNIVGCDVVEVNNDFDNSDLTNQIATTVILQLLGYMTK